MTYLRTKSLDEDLEWLSIFKFARDVNFGVKNFQLLFEIFPVRFGVICLHSNEIEQNRSGMTKNNLLLIGSTTRVILILSSHEIA